jgi:hypothetical protein
MNLFKVEIPAKLALDQSERALYRYAICSFSPPRHKSVLYVQLQSTLPDHKLTHCHSVSFIPNETPGVREHAVETQ